MLFIFDMGGVVTTTFQIDTVFNKLKITRDDFFDICKQNNKDIWHQLEIGKITTEDFWGQFNKRVSYIQRATLDGLVKIGDKIQIGNLDSFGQIPNIKTDLFRLYFHPELNQKTVEIINKLKKKHRVVCGTNTIQSHWENHMERGDYSLFHQTYASNKIGLAKPNPLFFTTIMEAEDALNPSEVFFTDDKEENCKAAASTGINVVRFTTAENLEKQWEKYF